MGYLKQIRVIDGLIKDIETIALSQCSLSEQDLTVLNEALDRLKDLKRKKGRTNEQVLDELVIIVGLLTKFFV